MAVLDNSIPINKYFEDICKIPHGSKNEEKLANYIVDFAIKHNLKYFKDEMHNVIIYKDASVGYKDHETVMLQGHIDMVNEKNNDSNHDFDKDPLDLYIDDEGLLCAKGTTLGADDGTAVAYMLAILEDNTLKHPALDCVFTVQEEIGLFGAMNIKKENIRAHKLINLDDGGETETCVTSSGGCRTIVSRSFKYEDNNLNTYKLEVKGLLGGHSGGCINMERGNANKLIVRILHDFMINDIDIRLVNINGGLKENAIPRESTVIFNSSKNIDVINKVLEESNNDIFEQLKFSDDGYQGILTKIDNSNVSMNIKDSEDIIRLIYLLPNGFKAR